MFRQLATRQYIVDVAIAGVFCFLLLPFHLAVLARIGGGYPIEGYLVVGMSAALALRRISPALSLSAAWVVAVVQMIAGAPPLPFNAAILAILYAVGRYGNGWVKWFGLVSALVGAVVAALYVVLALPGAADAAQESATAFAGLAGMIAGSVVLGLSWTVGVLVRSSEDSRQAKAEQYRSEILRLKAERGIVVEQERNRIARDMHDVVAHSLAVVIAQADGARYAHRSNPAALDETLATISGTAREALGDVRMLLSELRHEQGDGPQPVLSDLQRLIEQMRAAGLDVQMTEVGEIVAMPTGHQIAVYRIVQEALTNVLRHGDTRNPVGVELAWRSDGVIVTVENVLRKSDAPPSGSGHGIPGMRERAVLAGGHLTVIGTDDRFRVTAFIPSSTVSA